MVQARTKKPAIESPACARRETAFTAGARDAHAAGSGGPAPSRSAPCSVSICSGAMGEWTLDKFVYENSEFAIRRVDVQTDGVISPDQLRRWSGVKPGDNLMALDLASVKRNLELVSTIGSVSVERVLPGHVAHSGDGAPAGRASGRAAGRPGQRHRGGGVSTRHGWLRHATARPPVVCDPAGADPGPIAGDRRV